VLIGVGVVKFFSGEAINLPMVEESTVSIGTQAVTIVLIIRAFASGCSAVTGVEAVSNAVPI
jgi:hypothetical protein